MVREVLQIMFEFENSLSRFVLQISLAEKEKFPDL
jgi:hypothetical protein